MRRKTRKRRIRRRKERRRRRRGGGGFWISYKAEDLHRLNSTAGGDHVLTMAHKVGSHEAKGKPSRKSSTSHRDYGKAWHLTALDGGRTYGRTDGDQLHST